MHPQLFEDLLEKYLKDKINPNELVLLLAAAKKGRYRRLMKQALLNKLQYPGLYKTSDEARMEELFKQMIVKAEAPDKLRRSRPQTWLLRAAAILLMLLGAGSAWKMLEKGRHTTTPLVKKSAESILPGKQGAILTLADGKQVELDSVAGGIIADQNGRQVCLHNGQLTYQGLLAGGEKLTGGIIYNTLSTPKGRQFQLILPDGSKVWLNAASSIKYPTVFTGAKRVVEITGEAYLEVTANRSAPFYVQANNTVIDVLGTSFNVNAYENEPAVKTTLISGSVRIEPNINSRSVILKPGQQASLIDGQLSITNDQSEAALAWKNGYFDFNNASLKEVMHQLERWYNIEVIYEKGIPDIHFLGEMSRNLQLADLLKALELSKVHFKVMEGRKLVVLP